jgi:pseudouridine-5'-phosphate glycosidase
LIDLVFSQEVADARAENKPLVALESTIITHGMPYPRNVETARLVEEDIRAGGAVPATMAVVNGEVRIGLCDNELNELGQQKDVMKLSRADLAYCVAAGKTGATTVAATMMLAELAGISVFATGGIGGVHRGADQSFDISADLEELGRTDVIVVCAGAKAILDLNKTFEVLETNGVPVISVGSDELPAFWSRESGLYAPLRMDTAQEIASHAKIRAEMGIEGGTLIANPVPNSAALLANEVDLWINSALEKANTAGITGKEVTPFLLGEIVEQSGGRSLETNIALVRNNARLAAEIAVALRS